jgi:hypothetical protein
LNRRALASKKWHLGMRLRTFPACREVNPTSGIFLPVPADHRYSRLPDSRFAASRMIFGASP